MRDKIGCLIIDIEGTSLTAPDKELLKHPLVGGIILFSRNAQSRSQLINLCSSIRQVRSTPLLIMVDQEGGRVQRFKSDFTHLPPLSFLGELYDKDPQAAFHTTKELAQIMASELLQAGIDLSLAPVVDIHRGINQIIGERAIHANPQVVSQIATIYIQSMHEAGMASTAKHFPGHGAVVEDSHLALPLDHRPLADIQKTDLLPFISLIKHGVKAIMAAHIIFPQVDSQPVSFSKIWLQTILRDQLQFAGVIFSDDLNMEGANISSNYAERVQMAREAGCDFALLCNNRKGVIQAIDELSSQDFLVNRFKWQTLVGNYRGYYDGVSGSQHAK